MAENPRGTIQQVGGKIVRVPPGQGASVGTIRAGASTVAYEGTAIPINDIKPGAGVVPQHATGISWAPLAAPHRLSFMGTSLVAVWAALEETFGAFPARVSISDERTLAGMAAAAGEGATPYLDLLTALRKHGELELRLET